MPAPRPGARLAGALALLGALAAAAAVRTGPPAPRPADAPPDAFSAARALDELRALLDDGAPRPVGSPANLRAVDEIASRLAALGLETEVQRTFACGIYGLCATVRNVVARLGPPAGKAVLLVAHHDSVPAGPGAADDLSGVAAVLEVARALAAGPPLARPFVALVTDAEESGLVGASAFAERHPLAREVGAVVNLEARGTTGPSLAFDTAGEPAWIARVLRRMPRPATTSLAPAVYDLLPNDTDLTTFERHGMPGVNLAFAFGVTRYHTALDDLGHLDAGSLQHQGENALALVRALAEEDLEAGAEERIVFLDVLGLAVVAYRRPLLVAALAALLAALAAWRLLARERRPVRALLLGLAAAAAAPALAAGVVLLAWLALRHGALPRPFVAHPGPFAAAAWAAGAAAALLSAAVLRAAGAAGLLAGAALLLGALGLALGAALPGGSYLFALPALAAGLAGTAWAAGRRDGAWGIVAAAAPAAVAALVSFEVAVLLPHLLGASAAMAVAALVALATLPVAALGAEVTGRARLAPGLAAAALALVLCGAQAALPHATPDAPERATLSFHEEGGEARWLVETESDGLPPALGGTAAFARLPGPPLPWSGPAAAFAAPAEPLGLPAPRLDLIEARSEGELRRVRARLRSARGARALLVAFPPEAEIASFAMEGIEVAAPAGKVAGRRGARVHGCLAPPEDGVEIEVLLRGAAPVPVLVADETAGLPPAGARLVAARPATAVPSARGDATLVSARTAL